MLGISVKLTGAIPNPGSRAIRPAPAKRSPVAMVSSVLASAVLVFSGGLCVLTASTTAASAACKEFQLPPDFSIRQSNGFAVTIHVAPDAQGDLTGSANYGVPPKIGQIRTGSFDGRVLSFRINWSGGGSGKYEGSVNQKGKLVGVTSGGGSTARFESIQKFACVN